MSGEYVRISVDSIEWETKNAVCVKIGGHEMWFPLSTISSIHKTTEPYIYVAQWIAKKKGLV